MAINIEVFYSFQSPYSYLAIESIYEIANSFDVEILWQPYSAKAAGELPAVGSIIPEKMSYLLEDTKRFAAEHRLPLEYPAEWPASEFDPGKATRGALVAHDMGVLMEYNYKVFQRWWGEGLDPNDDKFFANLCEELDVEPGEFLSKISSSDVRERVKGIYKRGKKLGVFDTPTFIIDKERIVGLDKIPYLISRLEKLNLKK